MKVLHTFQFPYSLFFSATPSNGNDKEADIFSTKMEIDCTERGKGNHNQLFIYMDYKGDLYLQVPQSIDPSEDEGFQSASNLTPDSQSEPSVTPDIDLWEAVLTYGPSKRRCWERIGWWVYSFKLCFKKFLTNIHSGSKL